jgi:hypothetical protein
MGPIKYTIFNGCLAKQFHSLRGYHLKLFLHVSYRDPTQIISKIEAKSWRQNLELSHHGGD